MRLKIISDGTGPGTTVVDEESGREIKGVVALQWEIGPGGQGVAFLKIRGVMADLIGDAVLRIDTEREGK